MADSAGFFNRAPAVNQTHKNAPEYIPAGGKQFHAVAVAFIDYFQNSARSNDVVIKKLLEPIYYYFPKYTANQPYLTPGERMGVLIHSVRKSELVECMAYAIRQITVNELYAHPLNYREAFNGLNANTTRAYLRQVNVLLPPTILRALANALGITIHLSFIEVDKELRKRDIYTGNAANGITVNLFLQIQGGHYFPKVRNGADFAYVGQLAIKPPEPVEDRAEADKTISDIIALIADDNKRLLRTYLQWQQNLSTMLQEDLKTSDLMDIYVHSLPGNNDVIVDSTHFFAQLAQTDTKPININSYKLNPVNVSLVNAIAAGISIGDIDADELDLLSEASCVRTASPAA